MFGILGFKASMGKRQKQVACRPRSPLASRPRSPPRENAKEMPIDLLIDIFSRLRAKDVARCRCVSKLWSSILRRREFTKIFLKMASVRPRILFTFLHNGKRIFFSIPQNQDLDIDSYYHSCTIYPCYQIQFPKGLGSPDDVCPSILGLICNKSKKPMICNPSTGEYISLPVVRTRWNQMRPYFGYDPIDKLFKVLGVFDDYVCRVATVGTGVVTWRMVEGSELHEPFDTEICIDGVLYYLAKYFGYMVVCFDVRLESFKFISIELQSSCSAFIDYKGKLGILVPNWGRINEYTESFELRVLEDADEDKWSTTVYTLPFYWKYLAADADLCIVGMTSACEIVISTCFLQKPFYVFYYNIVENTVVRVEIEFGVEVKKARNISVFTLINHVENVELMY